MAASSRNGILPDSSLSSPVYDLIDIFAQKCKDNTISESNVYKYCIDENENINWEILESVFETDATTQSAEWYSNVICNLSPAVLKISNVMMQHKEMNDGIMEKFQWTSNAQVFKKCFELMKSDDYILAMQLITSSLERALGNVYMINDEVVPFLLKDILSCDNLKQTIGKFPMQTLQTLIGPPVSLNLRNLVWHGFISPYELPINYCWFLFAVIMGIGDILKKKNICPENIPQRMLLNLPQVNELIGKFPLLKVEQIKKLEMTMQFYHIISRCTLPCWILALKDFTNENYVECVIRLLPLLENVLRRLFAIVNECGERVLTAQSSVFYTTFDEILSQNFGENENKLRAIVGDNFLIMLYDLLSLASGPRLRDHLSHGELNTKCISVDLVNHIICIAVVACEIAQTYLEKNSDCISEIFPTIFQCVKHYAPVFPLHYLCKQQIKHFLISLSSWKNSTVIRENETVSLANLESIGGMEYIENAQCLPSSLSRFITVNDSTDALIHAVSSLKLDVLYRSQVELEKIGHIIRICNACHTLSEQIQGNVNFQADKLSKHKMRSRNRETYNRMLKVIPALAAALRITAAVLVDEFLNYNNNVCNNKLFRCLTHYIDNLIVMTSLQKNRWEESEQLTKTFISSLVSLLNR